MIYLAAAGSRRYFTGANPGYTANEVAHQMKSVDPAIVLVHETLLETGIAAAEEAKISLDRLFVFSDTGHPSTRVRGLKTGDRSWLPRTSQCRGNGTLLMVNLRCIQWQ